MQKLVAADGLSADQFGRSLVIRDSTIVVGTPWSNSNTGTFQNEQGCRILICLMVYLCRWCVYIHGVK